MRSAKAMGLEVAGVDMLEGKNGPKILEINSSPGLEGVERASGINVAAAIVAHAERYAADHRRLSKREVNQRLLVEAIQDERMPLARVPATRSPRARRAAS
jgi:ribosomal protein S6--L-glutamate ligase